jgi:hypothetical protein
MQSKMVSPTQGDGRMSWEEKKIVTVNKWTAVISPDGLRDAVSVFRELLRSESEQTFTTCMYGSQSSALLSIASICGGGGAASQRRSGTTQHDKPFQLVCETCYANTEDVIGNSQSSNIRVLKSTLGAESQVCLYEAPFLPKGSATVDTTKINAASMVAQGTMYDASCYTVVTNAATKLVGQLVGNCIQIKSTQTFSASAQLCLAPSDRIVRHSEFKQMDFALRTGSSSDNYVYTPLDKSISVSSGQYCASVTQNKTEDTWYCPIMRVAAWKTKTQDTGTRECPVLDSLVAYAITAKKCAAGDQTACGHINSVKKSTEPIQFGTPAGSSGTTAAPPPTTTTLEDHSRCRFQTSELA